jgi:hypothetical protein
VSAREGDSNLYAFRPRGSSLRIVHSLVSATVHLAVTLRLQDLSELWRIGANCNYLCNYKPIWLSWRSGGLPTPILPLLDGASKIRNAPGDPYVSIRRERPPV